VDEELARLAESVRRLIETTVSVAAPRETLRRAAAAVVMEFFGRDTREPARLFAERVLPAFR
jgi:hypothetical protein